jgi:hypothetical protein
MSLPQVAPRSNTLGRESTHANGATVHAQGAGPRPEGPGRPHDAANARAYTAEAKEDRVLAAALEHALTSEACAEGRAAIAAAPVLCEDGSESWMVRVATCGGRLVFVRVCLKPDGRTEALRFRP